MVDLLIPHTFTEQNSRKHMPQILDNQNIIVYQKGREAINLPVIYPLKDCIIHIEF